MAGTGAVERVLGGHLRRPALQPAGGGVGLDPRAREPLSTQGALLGRRQVTGGT